MNDTLMEDISHNSDCVKNGLLSSDVKKPPVHTFLEAEYGESSKKKRQINLEGCITELPPCELDPSIIDCEMTHKATQIWSPTDRVNDSQIDNFIHLAKINAGFNVEQAMAILYANNYNTKKARCDLDYFAPLQSHWRKDRKRFAYAINRSGKRFQKIQKLYFPHKSISQLVEYYYTWKTETIRKRANIFDSPIKIL